MKKIVAILMAMIMVISVTVVLAGSAPAKDTQPKVPVIIGFESTPGPADKAMVRGHGGDMKYSYTLINAIAAKLPEPAIENIQKNQRVTYVEMDVEVHTLEDTLPWGVDRIDAELVWSGAEDGCDVTPGRNAGAGAIVAIIDTGLDKDHPDLAANIAGGRNFVGGFRVDPDAWDDDNGHGTHCGGIVAAVDNEEGIIGVAPEASLYGVKVLDRRGSGYLSDIIAGIEWAVENDADIISMSLGTTSDVLSLHDACDAAWNNGNGVLLVAAAGNEGGSLVIYPAAYSSVTAVSATNSDDNLASFSSTGPEVELAAPGVNIYSTYKKDGYATMSGTSMACPHVAGTAALAIGESNVRQCLQDTAEDLGEPGKDNLYGYGLVDADEAVPSTGNQAPVADAGEDQTALVDETVSFDGSGSSDPDGDPLTYAWDFGDETTDTGETTTHVYDTAGTYTVALTVTDDEEATGTDTASVIVTAPNEPPVADANGPYTGIEGDEIHFDGTGSDDLDGDPLTYAWNFGDGSTGTSVNPTHAYTAGGTYTVSLVVNDGKADSEPSTATADITEVNDPPVADAGSDQNVVVDEVVTFDGSGSYDPDGAISTYNWNFGDETTRTGITTTHTYGTAREYTVELTVTDDGGSTDTDTAKVTVTEVPAYTMHIANIVMSLDSKTRGRNIFVWAVAKVTIVDESGSPVEGATVSGYWSGATSDSDSGVTDVIGQISLKSDSVKNPPSGTTFTFTVDDVTKTDWTYDTSASETSGSTTVQ